MKGNATQVTLYSIMNVHILGDSMSGSLSLTLERLSSQMTTELLRKQNPAEKTVMTIKKKTTTQT